MKMELWRRAEDLFHAAVKRPLEARRAFLDEACAGDAELRRVVEELLSKDAAAGSFLEEPALLAAPRAAGGMVGRQCGPYRITALLGAGGRRGNGRRGRQDRPASDHRRSLPGG